MISKKKIFIMLKRFAKKIVKNISPIYLERILSQSILKNRFSELESVKDFTNKKDLWFETINLLKKETINFLEFGVWEGDSIKEFSKLNQNHNSKFYGFDSFMGLPNDWDKTYPKGYFSVNGLIPKTTDKRITFIKGWFQNTLPTFLEGYNIKKNLIVHYDADLYSSTLFCLSQIDSLKIPYIAIFDEFYSHEMRALENYKDAFGAKIQFLGKTTNENYPIQVSCRIIPSKFFQI